MVLKRILLLIVLCFFFFPVFAGEGSDGEDVDETRALSVTVGSFIYHLRNNDFSKLTKYHEYFDNNFFALSVELDSEKYLRVGTFLNSWGNRCFILGVKKNWYRINRYLAFSGFYAYAGEFFFDAFKLCNTKGLYRKWKRHIGIPVVPFIWHGFEYSPLSFIKFEGGFFIPYIPYIVLGITAHIYFE